MSFHAGVNFCYLALLMHIVIVISDADVEYTTGANYDRGELPVVTIPQGTLQGIKLTSRHNRSISGFLGIPYAKPPIGELRFSNPVAAGPWNGTLIANVDGISCTQTGLNGPSSSYTGKEDCLFLNVYTPQLPKSGHSRLPVMVFVHGGGFAVGSSSSSTYGPEYLLDADVLLVTMNYRLGLFGFLSTGDEVASGNWGLKDQVLALKWVQKNIAYFGGDHNRVTLFGESAGAAAVQLLALSDSTIGLFHKFISQSGAAYGFLVHQPKSTAINHSTRLGESLGCSTNTSSVLIECLRKFTPSEIISTASQLYTWRTYPTFSWGPTDEPDMKGALLTDSPTNLLAAGKIRDLPSMTGVLKDEGVVFTPGVLPDSEIFGEFIDNFDELLPIVLQYTDQVRNVSSFTTALKKFYFKDDLTTNRTQTWSKFVELVSDAMFLHPVHHALQKQLSFARHPTFFYSFEYRGTYSNSDALNGGDLLKGTVIHGDDIFYLFPSTRLRSGTPPSNELSEADVRMIDTMVQLWTSFAIHGTPKTTVAVSNTTWMPYTVYDNYLRIGSGSDASLTYQYNYLPERMQFWAKWTGTGLGNVQSMSSFLKFLVALFTAASRI